jgi:hypothetical protein
MTCIFSKLLSLNMSPGRRFSSLLTHSFERFLNNHQLKQSVQFCRINSFFYLTFSQSDCRIRVSAGLGPADAVDCRDLEAVDGVGLQHGQLVDGGRRVGVDLLLQVLELRFLVGLNGTPPVHLN